MSLDTPVAFFIFNRPDLTEKVFAEIAKVKPKNLFVIADGPRSIEEKVKCDKTKEVVQNINWDCNLLRNYSDINLGCKVRLSTGLSWIFDQVDHAIILEDDCLPDISFFGFCSNLLEKYYDDQRVMHIGGGNFLFNQMTFTDSYYFSRYAFAGYGWATWRRAWKKYDVNIDYWPELRDQDFMKNVFEDPEEQWIWHDLLNRTYSGEIDTWDFQWFLTCWVQSGLAVIPSVNLVSNLGFRPDATHTNTSNENTLLANVPRNSITQIKHPVHVFRNAIADKITFKHYFMSGRDQESVPNMIRSRRLLLKLKQVFQ